MHSDHCQWSITNRLFNVIDVGAPVERLATGYMCVCNQKCICRPKTHQTIRVSKQKQMY